LQDDSTAGGASAAWARHYAAGARAAPLYPESFVVRVFRSERPVAFIAERDYRGQSVLDLGCGRGRHVLFLEDLGMRVMGLEVSGEQVEALRARFPDAAFVTGSNTAIPAAEASFDWVLAVNSIYYLDSPQTDFAAVMAETARVLKPGGRLVASIIGHRHALLARARRDGAAAVIARDAVGGRASVGPARAADPGGERRDRRDRGGRRPPPALRRRRQALTRDGFAGRPR